MPWNSAAPLAAIVAKVGAIAGVQSVYVGVPESIGTRVSAYVTLAGSEPLDKATGLAQRTQRYRVTWGYRLQGAEATAETTLCAFADAFMAAMQDDRDLGATVASSTINASAADEPMYQPFAGNEYRLYPMTIVTTQYRTFDPAQ